MTSNPKRPTARAKRLRQNSTTGEQAAWAVLRKFRHYGFPVRRQHPISGIIVDFAIPKAKLIIEIDGSIHNKVEIQQRDAERDDRLRALGWRVIRIPNDEAFAKDHLFAKLASILGVD